MLICASLCARRALVVTLFIHLFLCAATVQVRAQSTAMTCAQATTYALRHNPNLKVLRANALIAMQSLNASQIFPTNPYFETTGKGKAKPNPLKVSPYEFAFALSWKFPIGGRWTSRQRAAKAVFQRVQSEVRAAQFDLSLKTQKACFGLLLEQEKVELYRGMTAFYQRVYQIITRRKISGAATVLDINLARLELLQSRASLSLSVAEVRAKRRSLIEVLGWTLPTPPTVKGRMGKALLIQFTLAQLQGRAQQTNVLLDVLHKRISEVQASLRWAEAKAIPDLKFKLYYAFEEGDNHIFGGGLSIPIPLFSRNQSKIWPTREKLNQSRLKLAAMRFKIRQIVAKTFIRWQAGWNVFQLYETQLIPTLKRQIQLRERGLQLGTFTILQVISAQQSQNKALLKRINSLKQVLNSYIALQKAIGGAL